MKWTTATENKCMSLRGNGYTYAAVASALGTTANSVKHKVRRIQQGLNNDRYKHTNEKIEIAKKVLTGVDLRILETHSGFGGMTEFYARYGYVECFDIKNDRVEYVNNLQRVHCRQADSEKEIIKLLADGRIYDVIDVDPYGMPSRYFPYVFGLIENGLLFITLPMIGVAQMNKITIRHLQAFWGVDYRQKEKYIPSVIDRLIDYAFMFKREIKILSVDRIDRVYRFAVQVQKKSLCDIVGLKVKKSEKST